MRTIKTSQGAKVTEEYDAAGQLSKISREIPPRKTWWDWLQLLIIPLVLLGIGSLLSYQQNQTSLQVSERQHQADLQIAATRYANDQQLAADQQRETTLKTYLDDMSNLLLTNKLLESKSGEAVRQVARERTLTTLRRLDAKRNQIVLQFLQDSWLIDAKDVVIEVTAPGEISMSVGTPPVIDLSSADMRHDDLRETSLLNANLHSARLNEANLSDAVLTDAILTNAYLSGANLHNAYLYDAYLYAANLSGTNLSDAVLGPYLSDANFSNADLSGAILNGANLSGATLIGANLSGAYLDKTILKGVRYNTEEILTRDPQGKNTITGKLPPTTWPQGFDPKAAGAIEDNASNCYHDQDTVEYGYQCLPPTP